MSNAISMVGLTKHYKGVQALTDLTLDVPAGHGLRLPRPERRRQDDGAQDPRRSRPADRRVNASVNGVPVSAAGDHRRELGYLAQDPRFYGWMTGRETLQLRRPPPRSRCRTATAGSASSSSASASPTPPIVEPPPTRAACASASGIAQALVGRPAVILLDEPVSALDPIGRKDVLDLMRELKGETTVFYSTHILDDVQRVSDHVAILDHGRLVKAAPTQVLLGSFTKNILRVVLGGADQDTVSRPSPAPGRRVGLDRLPRRGEYDVRRLDPRRRLHRRPALHHRLRRRRRA